MSIICVKPTGINLPSESILKQCWESNPHGAGFARHNFQTNKIEYAKGFLEFEDFIHRLENSNMCKEDTIVYYFNLVTNFILVSSDEINQQMCQPFPASADKKDLISLSNNDCQVPLIFHDGIIGKRTKNLTDSAFLIKQIIDEKYLPISLALKKYADSNRFVYMDYEEIQLLGEWIKEDGLYFSNDSYKRKNWILDREKINVIKPTCPYCYCENVSHISKHQNKVFECNQCGCIIDGCRNIIFNGKWEESNKIKKIKYENQQQPCQNQKKTLKSIFDRIFVQLGK